MQEVTFKCENPMCPIKITFEPCKLGWHKIECDRCGTIHKVDVAKITKLEAIEVCIDV